MINVGGSPASQRTQFSSYPRKRARPSGVSTQGRSARAGMADVLAVAACQHRDPVAYLILLPADDGTLHQVPLRRVAARISSPVP